MDDTVENADARNIVPGGRVPWAVFQRKGEEQPIGAALHVLLGRGFIEEILKQHSGSGKKSTLVPIPVKFSSAPEDILVLEIFDEGKERLEDTVYGGMMAEMRKRQKVSSTGAPG